MLYGFLLGKNPELSLAEIAHYLKNRNIDFQIKTAEKDMAIISAESLDAIKLSQDLGGTIKIGYSLQKIESVFDSEKMRVGLSVYPRNKKAYEEIKKEIAAILKSKGAKFIFVSPKFHGHTDLKHFEVLKKILKRNGVEIFVFLLGSRHYFKTMAVHDPSQFKQRDVYRPKQRAIYSIPPRLAKILINLSCKPNQVLLDPFCGIGTILQEALLMNINVIGIDKNPKCIQDAKENIEWLKKKYSFEASCKLLAGDATRLSEYFDESSIDAIATEPYLGPPLKSKPKKYYAEKLTSELEGTYEKFLSEAWHVLKDKGKISLVLPNFLTKDGEEVKIDKEKLIKVGFKLKYLIDEKTSLIDADERQMTRREIVLLEKV